MPLPHSANTLNAIPNQSKDSTAARPLRAPSRGQLHSLLDTSCSPTWVSHPQPLLPPVRALSFHFHFMVSNLTSPLSAFLLFLHWSPFPPLSTLQPYSRSTDNSTLHPRNSSAMMLRGNPTAMKPLAVDTNHRLSPFLRAYSSGGFPSLFFRYSKPGGGGGGGEQEGRVCAGGIPKVIKKGGFEHFTVHIFAYRLM